MKGSGAFHLGLAGSWRITSKYSVTINSTAESDPPGWPDFASVIISITSRRMRFEIAASSVTLPVVCMCFYCSIAPAARYTERMSLLPRLEACKGKFGADAAREVLALLKRVEQTRFRDPQELIHLHETV